MKKYCVFAFAGSVLAMATASAAVAQDGDYGAKGTTLGAFQVFPKSTFAATSTDNVFATNSDTESDVIFSVAPSVDVNSLWNRHELTFQLGAENRSYSDFSEEDGTDYLANLAGRLDVWDESYLYGSAGYERRQEKRTSNEASTAVTSALLTVEPIEYEVNSFTIGGVHKINRLGLTAEYDQSNLNFFNGELVTGGVSNQNVRDLTDDTVMVRADWSVSPDTSLFVRTTMVDSDYDLEPPFSAFDRDSSSTRIDVGVDFKVTNILQGDIHVGTQEREFDDASFDDVDSSAYGAGLTWLATPLLTVGLEADRSIRGSTVAGSSSFVDVSTVVSANYEWRRNVIFSANVLFGKNDFDGIDRDDDRFGAGLKGTYLVNNRVGLFAGVNYFELDSSVDVNSFESTGLSLGVNVQY